MRGQRVAADGAHAQGGEGKHAGLHRIGTADRQAQAQQRAHIVAARAQQTAENPVLAVGRSTQDVQRQGQSHTAADQGCGHADAAQAQVGQAEPALDQCVIDDEVGEGADDANGHYRAGVADGAGEAAQGHEAQVAGQGEGQRGEKLHGPGRGIGLLAQVRQQRTEGTQAEGAANAQQQGQPQAALQQARGPRIIAGAVAHRDQAAYGCDHADAEQREHVVTGSAKCAAGQLLGAEHAHHDGVGEYHQYVGQLCGDQGPGQAEQGREFGTYCVRHDE